MSIRYEPGAPVAADFVPLSIPQVNGNEWAYIKECLDGGWVSSVGAFVERFERELAAYVGLKHGVATNSGTAALHIALLAAGVEADDEVIVSNLTFVAPVNAIHYVGAHPVLMDAESRYWQMDVEKVADFLSKECEQRGEGLYNRATGRRVRALMPVHILGHPVDMLPLTELARQYELVIVGDASECLGAMYRDRAASAWGDIACCSFNGNKIMTTGNGGMIVTDNDDWAWRAKYLSTQAKDDPVEYNHEEVGYNYRLSNVSAAMGCAQLEQMPDFVAKKRAIAERYREALAGIVGVTPMQEAEWAFSTFWMYTVLVDEAVYGVNSRDLIGRLQDAKIQSRPLWRPMNMIKPYRNAQAYRIEVSPHLYRDALSLPCSVGLTDADQSRVIAALQRK